MPEQLLLPTASQNSATLCFAEKGDMAGILWAAKNKTLFLHVNEHGASALSLCAQSLNRMPPETALMGLRSLFQVKPHSSLWWNKVDGQGNTFMSLISKGLFSAIEKEMLVEVIQPLHNPERLQRISL